jgi:ABC-2 type transport system permease protein
MHRVWAIIERDLRRFRRSPVLVIVSMVMPLVQLVVLGYAFGGKIKNLQVGVVDRGSRRAGDQIAGNVPGRRRQRAHVHAGYYSDQGGGDARFAQRENQRRAGHSAGIFAQSPGRREPAHRAVEDNTDQFSSSALEGALNGNAAGLQFAAGPPRMTAGATLAVVEVYPYVPYIQYLLPGVIVLAIFVSAMIGGGIIFIDDKARGLHEGYLVTPIRKFELILGFTLAGAAKAIIAGVVLDHARLGHRGNSRPA